MPTTTTTYSFNKPVVGADEDDWGGYLNGNWDSVDDLLDGTTPVTGIDINSGTLDGVTIGGTTAGAGTFTTLTATGTTTLAGASTSADITFGDNDKAIFGAGSDLSIYHDGSKSLIEETGTGSLTVRGTHITFQNGVATSTYANFVEGAEVSLRYNNATKLATTSTGIDVTGTVTADGLTVDTNTLYVDSTNNGVGIGTSSVNRKFVVSEQGANGIEIDPNISGESEIISYNRSTSAYTPLKFAASSIEINAQPSGAFIVNQGGTDTDFRVESDSSSHMLFVDAGNNSIGINSSTTYTTAQTVAVGNTKAEFNATQWSSFSGAQDGSGMFAQNLYRWHDGSTTRTSYTNTHGSIGGAGVIVGAGWNTGKLVATNTTGTAGAEATNLKAQLTWQTDQVIVNDDGDANIDFRVESNNNANAFLIDAGNDLAAFAVKTSLYDGSAGNSPSLIFGGETAAGPQKSIYLDTYYMVHQIHVNEGAKFRFTSGTVASFDDRHLIKNSEVVWNETSKDSDFRVESNNNANALVVDAGNDKVFIMKAIGSDDSVVGVDFRSNGQITGVCNHATRNMVLNNISGGTHDAIQFQYLTSEVGSVVVSSAGTTYNTTSDRRLKTDIQPIENGTKKLMAMNPVTHKWIAEPEADAVHGFIAQEMQEIVPESVSGDPDGEEMMSMDYGRITPVLVAALQDAHNKITALEKRLAEMEAK